MSKDEIDLGVFKTNKTKGLPIISLHLQTLMSVLAQSQAML